MNLVRTRLVNTFALNNSEQPLDTLDPNQTQRENILGNQNTQIQIDSRLHPRVNDISISSITVRDNGNSIIDNEQAVAELPEISIEMSMDSSSSFSIGP